MNETSDPPHRRPYHHGDLRRALIEAGLALLAREGAGGLDLRKVAREAGVSHAAPYRHFADKQALLAAIAEDGFDKLAAQVDDAIANVSQEGLGQLQAAGRAYLHFAVERPAHLRLMFSAAVGDRQPGTSLYSASKAGLYLLAGIIERGQLAGEIVDGDPINIAQVIWSLVHGLAVLVIDNQLPIAVADTRAIDELTRSSIEALCQGIRRR